MIQPMSQSSQMTSSPMGLHQTALGKADAEQSGHVSVCILLDPLQRLIPLILPSLILDTLSLFPRTLYFPVFPPISLAGGYQSLLLPHGPPHLNIRVSQSSVLGLSSKFGISTSLTAFNTINILTSPKFSWLAEASLLDSTLFFWPRSIRDLSSPTRDDQTHALCRGSADSQPLDHQGNPWIPHSVSKFLCNISSWMSQRYLNYNMFKPELLTFLSIWVLPPAFPNSVNGDSLLSYSG